MSASKRAWLVASATAVVAFGALHGAPTALADPETPPPAPTVQPDGAGLPQDPPPAGQAPVDAGPHDAGPHDAGPHDAGPHDAGPHNVVYRARVDGVSRGAAITYRLSDTDFNTATPTMVPGRTFEATGVVTDPQQAGMQVSIQWPYSASLHCEILVDDQIVAQADQFVAPRLTPQRNDPGYGVLSCGSVTNFPTGNTESTDGGPAAVPPPAEPPAPAGPAAPPPAT